MAKTKDQTVKQFAVSIGISRKQAHQYVRGEAIPRYEVMLLIFAHTNGEITPDDFYDITLTFVSVEPSESQIEFAVIMKLERWLKLNDITLDEFALTLGVSRSQVHKYIYEGAIPRYEIMRLIFHATGRAVTPNTFYNIALTFITTNKKLLSQAMEALND